MRIEKGILFKNIESAAKFTEAIHNRLKGNLDYINSRVLLNNDSATVTIITDSNAEIECDGCKKLIVYGFTLDDIAESFSKDIEKIHLEYKTDDRDLYIVGAINDYSTDDRRLLSIVKKDMDPTTETYSIVLGNLHRTVIKSCEVHGAKTRTLHVDIIEKDSYLFDNLLDDIEKCGMKLENTSNRSATVSINLEDASYDELVNYCKQMVGTIVSSWDSIHCPEHIRDAATVDNIVPLYNNPEKDKIDELMIPLIELCNVKGYTTVASCAGHCFSSRMYIKFKRDYDFLNLPNPWVLSGDGLVIQTAIGTKSFYDMYIERAQIIKDLFDYFVTLPDRRKDE